MLKRVEKVWKSPCEEQSNAVGEMWTGVRLVLEAQPKVKTVMS